MVYQRDPLRSCPRCGKATLRPLSMCVLLGPIAVDDIGDSEYLLLAESETDSDEIEFCNWCAVSFDPTEPEPIAHRYNECWSEVPWPTEPVHASLAALWERATGSGIRAVATEKTLLQLLPKGIVHNRWWEFATGLTVVTSEDQAKALEDDPDCYLLETHTDDFLPGWNRSIQHRSSLLDPVGVLAVATPDGIEVFVPDGGTVDPTLLGWRARRPLRPKAPKPVTQLEEEIDRLLKSFASEVDESSLMRVEVVWGEPHFVVFMLESRARMLAEAWTALHEHEVWMEAERAVSPETAEWLADVLDEFLSGHEYGKLAPSTALSLFTKEAAELPDLWPYPNSEEEFDLFVKGLNESGREMIGEAFDDEVIMFQSTMLDGLIVSIEDPQELIRLFDIAGVVCHRDDELIRTALGTWR